MKLSQFKFNLPEEQVALYPHSSERVLNRADGTSQVFKVTRRDEARLMVVHKKSETIDMYNNKKIKGEPKEEDYIRFKDVVNYFDEGDTFIFNDTKVFPARLYGTKEKTDAKIEVFLLRELNQEMRLWDVLVEPARKIRIGNKLFFDESGAMVAEVIDNTTSRGRTLRFLYDCSHEEFKRELYALGEAPLPRYIIDNRPKGADEDFAHADADDLENFQTVFAKHEGAVTAPGTNLHFSEHLMKMMEIKGIHAAYITLHCGLGNFHDIEVEDLTKHKMDSEEMHISAEACKIVNETKAANHQCLVARDDSVGFDEKRSSKRKFAVSSPGEDIRPGSRNTAYLCQVVSINAGDIRARHDSLYLLEREGITFQTRQVENEFRQHCTGDEECLFLANG